MILINCPHCGERNEDGFLYGGDVEHRRPVDPDALTDSERSAYIYCIPNTKGWAIEHWWHVRGSNRWIILQRNSIDNKLRPATDEGERG